MSEALEGHTWPLAGSRELVGGNPGQTVLSFQTRARPCQLLDLAALPGCWRSSVSGTLATPTLAVDSGLIPRMAPSLAIAAVTRCFLGPTSWIMTPGLQLGRLHVAASSSRVSSVCGHLQTELLEPSWGDSALSMTSSRV